VNHGFSFVAAWSINSLLRKKSTVGPREYASGVM